MTARWLHMFVASSLFILACEIEPTPAGDEAVGSSETDDGTGTGTTETGDGDESYPPEPHGIEVGEVFGVWEWVREDESIFSTQELYGIPERAVVIYGTAAWCGTCREELIEELMPALAAMSEDVMPVGVIFEDAVGNNPTAQTVFGYNLSGETFEFVADTERDFDDIFPGELAIPRVLVLDSRDMRITYKYVGYDVPAIVDAVDEILEGD